MPTYAYMCEKCEHVFEKVERIANRSIHEEAACPSCGAEGTVHITPQLVGFGDPVKMGFQTTDNGFREVMQRIHARNPKSRLNEVSTITKL